METVPASVFDPQMCRRCAGLCCQAHPGMWVDPQRFFDAFPLQVPSSPEVLDAALEALGLRFRKLLEVPVPVPVSTEAGCFFLGVKGCRLSPLERPCQCLALVPEIDTLFEGEIRCRLPPGFGSGEVHRRWEQFWQFLEVAKS